jgi:hypothetical protein
VTGLRLDIDARAVVDLAAAWSAMPARTAQELAAAVWESALLLEREAKENTPVGAGGGGGLKGSIAAREPRRLADTVLGEVGTPLAYALPVELGTRPHFPPVQPLADWAVAKLGVPRDEAQAVGFRIARKIAKRGTEGAFMFTRALAQTTPQIEAICGRALLRLRDALAGGQI